MNPLTDILKVFIASFQQNLMPCDLSCLFLKNIFQLMLSPYILNEVHATYDLLLK